MAEKRVVELTDFEHRVMMKALSDQRNELLSKEQSTEDLSEIILKVIDAPTEKERKKQKREERKARSDRDER